MFLGGWVWFMLLLFIYLSIYLSIYPYIQQSVYVSETNTSDNRYDVYPFPPALIP